MLKGINVPNNRNDSKLYNPLSKEERSLLKTLASFAKEEELLEGRDRKLLFQSGQFSEWFPNTLKRMPGILKELVEDIDDPKIDTIVQNMIINLLKLSPETMVLEKKYVDKTITSSEKVQLAEFYEREGNLSKALIIAEQLYKEYPDNESIELLLARIQ